MSLLNGEEFAIEFAFSSCLVRSMRSPVHCDYMEFVTLSSNIVTYREFVARSCKQSKAVASTSCQVAVRSRP